MAIRFTASHCINHRVSALVSLGLLKIYSDLHDLEQKVFPKVFRAQTRKGLHPICTLLYRKSTGGDAKRLSLSQVTPPNPPTLLLHLFCLTHLAQRHTHQTAFLRPHRPFIFPHPRRFPRSTHPVPSTPS